MSSLIEKQHNELLKVTEELSSVEEQIRELMKVKKKLFQKKTQLEESLNGTKSNDDAEDQDWVKTDFPWSKKLEETRSKVFNMKHFRPFQLQAMNATLSGKDCIVIMPTGGGKSLCFQLPALLSNGITLVVSPLISLMEDQIMSLNNFGVKASLLNASSSKEEVNAVQSAMVDKKLPMRLLYVTPEKLAKSKRFMGKLEKMFEAGLFARLVIDEVHCCSQWGHDFRPDYKFLGVMKRQFPGIPILGLTATATNDVIDDVKKMLGIPTAVLFKAPLNRPNLYYEVHPKPSASSAAMDELYRLISMRFKEESGIIYCLTQKDTEEVTREMHDRGLRAGCYHANMNAASRSQVHRKWTNNQIQVVVATIAFGMGIDKPDVRFVIHHSISKSMENYYQESGRAGRDDKRSHCILFVSFADIFRQSTMVFTEQTGLEKLYGMAAYAFDPHTCRRALTAYHFGETWDASDCNQMCDHCSRKDNDVVKKDVTKFALDLLAILNKAKLGNQRVTGLKLLDTWTGKGNAPLRVNGVHPPSISREDAEKVLIHLLLNGFLREDFHFTPYSTISYLLPGNRANCLQAAGYSIEMEFQTRSKQVKGKIPDGQSKKVSACRSKPAGSVLASVDDCIEIKNSKNKCLTDGIKTPKDGAAVKKGAQVLSKKRKLSSSESDLDYDDDDDLDDTDDDDSDVVIVKKKKVVTKSVITIDDDFEDDFEDV